MPKTTYTRKEVKALVKKARAAEREKCASFCDKLAKLFTDEHIGFDVGYTMAATRAANAIRNQEWKQP